MGGMVCHVVNRGNGRAEVFHDGYDYAAFVDLIGRSCERHSMRVLGACLMPNHFHLVVWPQENGDLSAWMQWLMTSHVRRHHGRYGTSGHVWQGRYKSFPIQPTRVSAEKRLRGVVEGGDAVLATLRYVERNPLACGQVTDASNWRWSSAHWLADPADAPLWWKPSLWPRPEGWLDHVNQPASEKELHALRQCIARGRPFGREPWVQRIANEFSLQTTLHPRGRPKNQPIK
jgi:putative transposase